MARVLALAVLVALLAAAPAAAQAPPVAVDPVAADGAAVAEREAEEAFAADDLETAVTRYRDAARLAPSRDEKVRLLMTIAWLEHLRGRDDAAVRALTDVLVLEPGHELRIELYSESFRVLFLDAQRRAVDERRERALGEVHAARRALGAEDLALARRHLQGALELEPDQPHALYHLALLDLREGRDDDALGVFQKIVAVAALRPGTMPTELEAGALTNLGALFQRRGMDAEALDALERAVTLDPRSATAWTNLGVARRRGGRHGEAAQAFRRAHELAPDDPNALNNLALALLDAADWSEAIALLRPATARFAGEARLWLALGIAHLESGDPAAARAALEQAVAADPQDAQRQASRAAVHLARLAYSAGDAAETARQASRALALAPDLADAHVYLGLGRKGLGDLEGARAAFTDALARDPRRADVHNNLGSVLYEMGRLDEAESAFRRALEIDPGLADASRNLDAIRVARAAPSPATVAAPSPASSPPPAVNRAGLGIRFADIDYAALGLQGAMVESVDPGSPAARAGLQRGDLILRVDGRAVSGSDDLLRQVAAARADVTLDLLRSNRPQRLVLPLR